MPTEQNSTDDEFVLNDEYIGPFMKSQSKMPLLRGENPSQQEYEYRVLDAIHAEVTKKKSIVEVALEEIEPKGEESESEQLPLSQNRADMRCS